mmetsp:Transcript_7317/g.11001  ORF Transcript_7317/g.11001 Transcript_7317/m.11001 type:complete len:245 (+) Transcript_7317:465-1199(+)
MASSQANRSCMRMKAQPLLWPSMSHTSSTLPYRKNMPASCSLVMEAGRPATNSLGSVTTAGRVETAWPMPAMCAGAENTGGTLLSGVMYCGLPTSEGPEPCCSLPLCWAKATLMGPCPECPGTTYFPSSSCTALSADDSSTNFTKAEGRALGSRITSFSSPNGSNAFWISASVQPSGRSPTNNFLLSRGISCSPSAGLTSSGLGWLSKIIFPFRASMHLVAESRPSNRTKQQPASFLVPLCGRM